MPFLGVYFPGEVGVAAPRDSVRVRPPPIENHCSRPQIFGGWKPGTFGALLGGIACEARSWYRARSSSTLSECVEAKFSFS